MPVTLQRGGLPGMGKLRTELNLATDVIVADISVGSVRTSLSGRSFSKTKWHPFSEFVGVNEKINNTFCSADITSAITVTCYAETTLLHCLCR